MDTLQMLEACKGKTIESVQEVRHDDGYGSRYLIKFTDGSILDISSEWGQEYSAINAELIDA